MTNPSPQVQYMNSPWPDKLRAMKVNDVLLITKKELTPKQVRNLVANCNYKWSGKALFKYTSDDKGDSIVVCVTREKDADAVLARKRMPRSPTAIKKAKSVALPKVAKKHISRTKEPILMPKPMEANAIVECTYVNGGTQTMRAADENELNQLLERCRSNNQVVEIITYKREVVQRKQVSWATA